MNALTEKLEWQIIEKNGKPEFAVLPYDQYLTLVSDEPVFPHEVIGLEIKYNNLIKAWRTFLKMTQKELAKKTGITQAALSQMEKPGAKPHGTTIEKMAKAMNLSVELLES
jgi:DNA-binding XRE family transcriptional regulator